MAAGNAGDTLKTETLTVRGMIDGVPAEVGWGPGPGMLHGLPEHKRLVTNFADAHAGERFTIHPEGGSVEAGLDKYESAWATVQRAFDFVDDVEGPHPWDVMEDSEPLPPDEFDTTDGMDRSFAGKWTPDAHPRWPKGTPKKGGKFMTKGEIAAAKAAGGPSKVGSTPARRESNSGMKAPKGAGPTRLKALPVPADPKSKGAIETHDPEEALKLLAQGKAVNLTQPRQVSVLLDKLAALAQEAKAKGKDAPDIDLCNVTVKGTSLFCIESKGIPRAQMPQLKGRPIIGTEAHAMKQNPDDPNEEVDLTPAFLRYLRRAGFKTRNGEEHAAYLKATQNQLYGPKIAGMMKWMEGGGDPFAGTRRMLITEDNYIVDGHHGWAATIGLDAQDNRLGNDKAIKVTKIDMDIIELLREAVFFAQEKGIPVQGFTAVNPANK